MIRLEMMPAAHGDALLLEYGPGDQPTHRTLIDAGPPHTYGVIRTRLLQLPLVEGRRELELVIVTHIDDDHIGGVIKLLQDDDLALDIGDVWFNDWQHFGAFEAGKPPVPLGAEQGEFLGVLIEDRNLPHNAAFGGAAIMVPPDTESPLLTHTTPGGLALTVIGPGFDELVDLKKKWESVIGGYGFHPGDRDSALAQFRAKKWAKAPGPVSLGDETDSSTLDDKEANGSSIAVVASYENRNLILSGDAHPIPLREGIERWTNERGSNTFDAFKVAHHGSDKNMTPQLLQVIDCATYLISTNGATFGHPDRDAIVQIIDGQPDHRTPELCFNYHQAGTNHWANNPRCVARYEDDAALRLESPD